MTGETTLITKGGSAGSGRSYGKSSGHSTNHGPSYLEKGGCLLMPDEVMRPPLSKQLLFVKSSAPLIADKDNYLTDPEFRGAGAKPLFDPIPCTPEPARRSCNEFVFAHHDPASVGPSRSTRWRA